MANEATIRASINIRMGNLDYRSNPTVFQADVADGSPPSPGRVIALVNPGTDVDLALLTAPGLMFIQNLDATNYITVGKYDPNTNDFHPMIELLPGEFYILRLSRALLQEFSGTGTLGVSGPTLRIKADTASCEVRADVFER